VGIRKPCFFCVLLLVLLAACAAPSPTPPPSSSLPLFTSSPLPSPTRTLTPTPTPVPIPERTRYTLDVRVDYDAHTVSVTETILYPNRTGEPLADLVLAAFPNLWPGCFQLTSLTVNSQPSTGHQLQGQQLTVTLAASLPPEETVELVIVYALDLPRTAWGNEEIIRNLIFGYTGKQMNLLDWYPFIVPYVPGQGWLLHRPGNYGEHLVYDTADFDVTVRFPDPANAPVVAAPAEGEPVPGGTRYRLENARTFALSFSPDFIVMRVASNDIIIQSYCFSDDAVGCELALQTAAQAVQVYSEKFAPYPHPVLTVVQGDFIPSMEYDGLVFVGHTFYHYVNGTPRDYLIVLTAHEVAHEWWFALIGNDQAMEPWLDEALATYSERIFYETIYPDDADWWQEIRITRREPLSGWVDTSIYDLNRSYTEAVYLRGAKFLGDLRQRVGDEAFFAFLHDYATTFGGRRATADDFFRILYQHTDADISDIIGTYFSRPH
jgi:aminopeptidase N